MTRGQFLMINLFKKLQNRHLKNLDAKYKGKMWAGGAVTQTLANTLGRNAVLSGNQNMASIASAVQDVGQVMSLMNQMRGKNGSFSGDKKNGKNQNQNQSQNSGRNPQNRNIQNAPVNSQPQRTFGAITRNNQPAPMVEKPKSTQEQKKDDKRVEEKNNQESSKKTNL